MIIVQPKHTKYAFHSQYNLYANSYSIAKRNGSRVIYY